MSNAQGNSNDQAPNAGWSIGFAERHDVVDEVIEFFGVDFFFGEAGHGAETEADLGFDEEARGRGVVDDGAEAALAEGVALVAMLHEENLAVGDVGIFDFHRTGQRLAAPR